MAERSPSPEDYRLQVVAGRLLVGWLRFDPQTDAFSFGYAPDGARRRGAFQLSPHIPFGGQASSVTVRRFIQNLLPEGAALDTAAVYNNVSKNNTFALIHALGGESAGALRFLPAGRAAPTEAIRRHIPLEELQRRIEDREQQPFIVWDGKVRISVAGYQDKLQVLRDEAGELYLVDGALSSTHILKPESRNALLPNMVANEHFCLSLVNRISGERSGADWAARAQILRAPAPVLCVQRFDRRLAAGAVESLHILDGCQALDRPVEHKYERNIGTGEAVRHIRDGVSFQALGGLRRDGFLANAAVDLRQIAMWAFTTLLLGNSDAHGKNLSFFVRGRSLAVAPFYDLVCTAVYDASRIEQDLAMAFGDEFSLPEIRSFALADFCERLGWPRRTFARELTTLCALAKRHAQEQAGDPVYVEGERAFVQTLADYVVARADLLAAQAADIPKFGPDNFR
jgi:serine/threonine-protein kinase HipA